MKRLLIIIITICLAACMTFDVLAGGDKVRGDNGTGTVSQQQVSGNPYERRP